MSETKQINFKMPQNLHEMASDYCEQYGYTNIQELLRESLREKIFDDRELNPEYVKKMLEYQKNPEYLGTEESEKLLKELELC